MSKQKKDTKRSSSIVFSPFPSKKIYSADKNYKISHSISQRLTHRLKYAWEKISNIFVRSRISSAGTDKMMGNDLTSIIDSEPAGAVDKQDDNQESLTMMASTETPTPVSLLDTFQGGSAMDIKVQAIQEEAAPAILVTEPTSQVTPSGEPVFPSSATLAASVEEESISSEAPSQDKPQAELQVSSEHSTTLPESEEHQSESSLPHSTATPPEVPDVLSKLDPKPDDLPPYLSLHTGEGPRFKFRIFRMEGSSSHAYQDAAEADPETGFVAIADGTTLGGYSEIVSKELVSRFVQNQCDLDDDDARLAWWVGTRKTWYAGLRARYNDASSTEQARWDKGGSATFMGLRICDDGTYKLHNVGDCSLLWFNTSITGLIHIDGATDFNSHPRVLHTDQENPPSDLLDNRITGKKIPSPTALLVTDALSKLFQETERWKNLNDFGELIRHADQKTLYDWFLWEKDKSYLEPDDFTFILLDFSDTIFNVQKDS